jgi:hypothetical protein
MNVSTARWYRKGRGFDHLKLLTVAGRESHCAWGSVGNGPEEAEFRQRCLYLHQVPLSN